MTDQRTLTVGGRQTTTHLALPRQRAEAGVLVLHPWWGLNADTTAYVDRLADAGFAAAAPDLYAGEIATTIGDAERLSDELNEDLADALVVASVDSLGAEIGDPSARIAALGFSMGAAWAVWLPAQRPEIAATVVYYGTVSGTSLSRARTPVLGHFAENDPYETDEGIAAFEETLRTAGREVTIHRYPGTGHWFAEPSVASAYDEAAAELAFGRTIDFLRRELLSED
jgi:carboxymethylenebutenolidase